MMMRSFFVVMTSVGVKGAKKEQAETAAKKAEVEKQKTESENALKQHETNLTRLRTQIKQV